MTNLQRYPAKDDYTGTVKQLADQARTRALSVMTGAEFARLCLKFESEIIPDGSDQEGDLNEGDEQTLQVVGLLKMLALDKGLDEKFWQLAMVWLDGHGYGAMPLEQLHYRLYKLREELRHGRIEEE